MKQSSSHKWIRESANVVVVLVAPFVHAGIYGLLCGFAFLGLSSMDVNPLMDPYGPATKVGASALAAFLVALAVFSIVHWRWWITLPILLLWFNVQSHFVWPIAAAEVTGMAIALLLVSQIRARRMRTHEGI